VAAVRHTFNGQTYSQLKIATGSRHKQLHPVLEFAMRFAIPAHRERCAGTARAAMWEQVRCEEL
jgi:hypothetical protein